jgi:hypothetical protein
MAADVESSKTPGSAWGVVLKFFEWGTPSPRLCTDTFDAPAIMIRPFRVCRIRNDTQLRAVIRVNENDGWS